MYTFKKWGEENGVFKTGGKEEEEEEEEEESGAARRGVH